MPRTQNLNGNILLVLICLSLAGCYRGFFLRSPPRLSVAEQIAAGEKDPSKRPEWWPIQGEESNDFKRVIEYIAIHDGQITLAERTQIHWFDTLYFRCYSNDTYVIVTYPPPFLGDKSRMYWFCGKVVKVLPDEGFAFAIEPDYLTEEDRRQGFLNDKFSCLEFFTPPYQDDGIFSIRFGEQREVTLDRLKLEIPMLERHVGLNNTMINYNLRNLDANFTILSPASYRYREHKCNISYDQEGRAVWMTFYNNYKRRYSRSDLDFFIIHHQFYVLAHLQLMINMF